MGFLQVVSVLVQRLADYYWHKYIAMDFEKELVSEGRTYKSWEFDS